MRARQVTCLLAAALTAIALSAATIAAQSEDDGLYDPELVREYEFTFDDTNWEAALNAAGDTGNVPARLVVGDENLDRVGVRYKGLSSMFVMSRKKPLNVTTDAIVSGQRLLGYDAVNLNNGYSDPSFVRESLVTEMLRPYMPAQQTAFAKVHVNDEYLGQYLAVEQVEGTFVSHWFPDSDGILVKADPPAGPGMGARTFHSSLEWEGENLDDYRTLYEVKTDGAEVEGLTAVREAARVLDAPVSDGGVSDADFPDAVSRVLDVDRALWYLAGNNIFVNYDSYYFGHNYFLYLSEDDGLFHMLLWDTSLSFGGLDLGTWESGGAGPNVDPFALEDSDLRPIIRRLLAVPEWRADYASHYRVLLDNAFDPDKLEARGAAMQALARPGLETDPNRLFSLDQFDDNLHEDVISRRNMGPGGRAPGIVKFARERDEWLREVPELATPDHRLLEHLRDPEAPIHTQPATVTLRCEGEDTPQSVRIVYRVDRGLPTAVELEKHGDSWRGVIPGQDAGAKVSYYARVELEGDRSAFHPEANLTQAWQYQVLVPELPQDPASSLVINELLAANDTINSDEAGEFDDWLELHNQGTSTVDLAGTFLSDDAADPWSFPLPDMPLEPGEFLLIWCDNDTDQGPLHASFALARGGESVVLSTEESILDQVDFGEQEADVSLARVPDGSGGWATCTSPSPGEANNCPGAATATTTVGPTTVATETPTTSPGPTETATPPVVSASTLYLPAAWR